MGKQSQPRIGLSVTEHKIEGAIFSPDTFHVKSVAYPLPQGVISVGGDEIENVDALSNAIANVIKDLNPKSKSVHLSIPATLLRLIDMPKMEASELQISLSSEAERYKVFDNTDAVVDFDIMGPSKASPGNQRLLFGAVRRDTLDQYVRAVSNAKLKVLSIDLEPVSYLRGIAGMGVLDSLINQIGTEALWGTLFCETDRVRLALWRDNTLMELREVNLSTRSFQTGTPSSIVIEDLQEEIRRTTKLESPAIWITYNTPESVNQQLESNLGVPVRPGRTSPNFHLDDPMVGIPTIGTTMREDVTFPVQFDFGKIKRPTKAGGRGAAPAPSSSGGGFGASTWLLAGLTVASAAIVILVYVGSLIWGGMLQGDLDQLTSSTTQLNSEITALTAEYESEKNKKSIFEQLAEEARKASTKNELFARLTNDIKLKTPSNLWLSSIETMEPDPTKGLNFQALQFKGISLNHQDVVNFARSFDTASYLSSVTINTIKEELLREKRILSFDLRSKVDVERLEIEIKKAKANAVAAQSAAPMAPTASPSSSGTAKP